MSGLHEGPRQSINDRDFILGALCAGQRIDGRKPTDMRMLRFWFSRAQGLASVEVVLGRTRVLAVVTSEVVPPFPARPTEGFLFFNVELSPMASAGFTERKSGLAVEITRMIETAIRDSQALDVEALCVLGGEKVWQLRCDVHVLDHGGNLTDACALAAMAALRHFRKPEASVSDGKVVVHHTDDREPQPLALHHVPLCVTFGLFEEPGSEIGKQVAKGTPEEGGELSVDGVGASLGQLTVVDPTDAEEEVMRGRVTFSLTTHRELCMLHKNGGVAMTSQALLTCARVAAVKVEALHGTLSEALQGADQKAKKEREARLRGGPGQADGAGEALLTPFNVKAQPMPVAEESLEVKHLDYDELHVTQQIREEGVRVDGGAMAAAAAGAEQEDKDEGAGEGARGRGGGGRGGREGPGRERGMAMEEARKTDLFRRMEAAARMTEASMRGEEEEEEPPAGGPAAAAGAGVGAGSGEQEKWRLGQTPQDGEEQDTWGSMDLEATGGGQGGGAMDVSNGAAAPAGWGGLSPAAVAAAADEMDTAARSLRAGRRLQALVPGVLLVLVVGSRGGGGGGRAWVQGSGGVTRRRRRGEEEDDDLAAAVKKGKSKTGKGKGRGKGKGKKVNSAA